MIADFINWATSWDWVAIGTLALASATVYLAHVTRGEVGVTREIERARRAEVAIAAAAPLRVDLPSSGWRSLLGGWIMLRIELANFGDRPIAAIRLSMRDPNLQAEAFVRHDILMPGESCQLELPVNAFAEAAENNKLKATSPNVVLVVSSVGMLRQQVAQTFDVDLENAIEGNGDHAFRQTRLEITPAGAEDYKTDIKYPGIDAIVPQGK